MDIQVMRSQIGLRWFGKEYASFERVCLTFEALNYTRPKPDSVEGSGAYGTNIVNQYLADLSENQVYAILAYSLLTSLPDLLQQKEQKTLTLHDVQDSPHRFLQAQKQRVARQSGEEYREEDDDIQEEREW